MLVRLPFVSSSAFLMLRSCAGVHQAWPWFGGAGAIGRRQYRIVADRGTNKPIGVWATQNNSPLMPTVTVQTGRFWTRMVGSAQQTCAPTGTYALDDAIVIGFHYKSGTNAAC